MRTTLRIDDDLFETIRTQAHEERVSMAKLVNRALRRGLKPESGQPMKRFHQETFDMGEPRFDVTKANLLAAQLEDEEIIRKMRAGR